jgi:hypothetical protein
MTEMQLDTLTPKYWQDFELTDGDLRYLSELLIEEEAPLTVEDLTRRLIEKRVSDEKAVWDDRESKGRVYQPRETYEEGDDLVFSAFGDTVGTVVGVRTGRHPDHDSFSVIQVRMEGANEIREFASNFSQSHALNFIQVERGEDVSLDNIATAATQLFERYGQYVTPVVLAGLHESAEFVNFGGEWFLKGFVLQIQEGHLNLAEAVLDLASGYAGVQEILNVLEMPADTSVAVQMFSLNHALASDEAGRFEFSGTRSRMEWRLPRVADTKALRFARAPNDISLDHTLDEAVEIAIDRPLDRVAKGEVKEWSHVLTFYDWYWGHLPFNAEARDLLDEPLLTGQSCSRVELRPASGGEAFPAIVYYPSERQLGWWGSAELRGFFETHELAPGATMKVRRTSSANGSYEIDYLSGPATRMEMLDYEEGGQPVFRRLSLRCQLEEELSLPRSRFSALEALSLLPEEERRVTSLLLKTAFQRVGEKLLRGAGIVYRASFTDLYVAANIERPLSATVLKAIFEQNTYPCFYIDEDGYYVHNPGRSDVQVSKVQLAWDEAILDSQSLKG